MADKAAVRLGRKGGKARAANMTAKQRKESAKKAALARWEKGKNKKNHSQQDSQGD